MFIVIAPIPFALTEYVPPWVFFQRWGDGVQVAIEFVEHVSRALLPRLETNLDVESLFTPAESASDATRTALQVFGNPLELFHLVLQMLSVNYTIPPTTPHARKFHRITVSLTL